MGKFDVPAMMNYILNQTGHQKLSYVGHSMGCAAFFIAMITHPQLNSKIDVMMAMAPAVAVSNTKSALFFCRCTSSQRNSSDTQIIQQKTQYSPNIELKLEVVAVQHV